MGLTVRKAVKKILYATDLSPEAPQVYQYVLFMANQFGAEVTCLHVIDQPSEEAQVALTAYLPREGSGDGLNPKSLGVSSVKKVVYGNVEDQILAQSQHNDADLIILGAHRKPNSDTYFNSISKRVLRRSKVPVTIVPIVG